jgi:hypothetical protein
MDTTRKALTVARSQKEPGNTPRTPAGAAQPSDGYGAVFTLLMAGFVAAAVLSNRQARAVTVLPDAAALVLTCGSRTFRLGRRGDRAGDGATAAGRLRNSSACGEPHRSTSV